MVYLDWAATSPPDPAILSESSLVAVEAFGNPSSRHALGGAAKAKLEEARRRLASAITETPPGSAKAGKLVFASGGTEADGIPLLALLRSALAARRDGSIKKLHLVTTEIEHSAIYEEALMLKSLGIGVDFVAPETDGRIDPSKIAAAIEKETVLVAVMAVNNETGAVQPIREIADSIAAATEAGRRKPRLHVDAVQALGKIDFDPAAEGAGSAAFSAHKIRGPRGIGALWVAEGQGAAALEPLSVGGGQEGSLRPGTESLQGAWAFAAAAAASRDGFAQRADHARRLEERLMAGIASIAGALPLPLGRKPGDPRYSPYILSVAFPGLTGEVLARALSDAGIAVSTGSACSSNSKRSGRRVMLAMGLPEDIGLASIRVSTGDGSTEADIDAFLEAAADAYRTLKA